MEAGNFKAWSGIAFSLALKMTEHDVLYIPIPLYHVSACIVGVSAVCETGEGEDTTEVLKGPLCTYCINGPYMV